MQQRLRPDRRASPPTAATVLLIGESGTGKELVAQTIHDLSRRRKRPVPRRSTAARSRRNLIESELFGHEKGSFTGADRQHQGFFERAHGGTLFLDEITEMPLELQVKLLRVLETGTLHARRRDRSRSADRRARHRRHQPRSRARRWREGKLREDLLYRLNVFPIAAAAAARARRRHRAARRALPRRSSTSSEGTPQDASRRDALARLDAHGWPGNVRELKNVVQRAYIMADEVIDGGPGARDRDRAGFRAAAHGPRRQHARGGEQAADRGDAGRVRHRKRKAADMLGISLKTLYNRLAAYKANEPAGEDDDTPPKPASSESHRRAA